MEQLILGYTDIVILSTVDGNSIKMLIDLVRTVLFDSRSGSKPQGSAGRWVLGIFSAIPFCFRSRGCVLVP